MDLSECIRRTLPDYDYAWDSGDIGIETLNDFLTTSFLFLRKKDTCDVKHVRSGGTDALLDAVYTVANEYQILLAEDEDGLCRLVQEEIEETFGNKIKTVCFPDGKSAFDYFRKNAEKIDLVISCLIMPEMGGVALLKKCKELKPHIPFIVYTSLDYRDDLDVMEAEAYVIKSPDTSELKGTIKKLLQLE